MKQIVDWSAFWEQDRLDFHQGQVNIYLQRFLPQFELKPGDQIFMPLCGKAFDILWLAQQGYQVVGVELSPIAVESFFDESGLDYRLDKLGSFSRYRAPNITLYQGDFMHLQAEQLAACKLVYDRAAIVAIEDFNRPSYSQHMQQIIPPSTPMLVVTLDYDQSIMTGPPFSVPLDEIRRLYQAHYRIDILHSSEQIDERPRWRNNGLDSLIESALCLDPIR
ncbi:MAG: thiopurine S-methyltransferase [Gammaproteobacteria bacterium]|nr:thiopurine S-methyltransferase [Gammaproteobacteria bacterium]